MLTNTHKCDMEKCDLKKLNFMKVKKQINGDIINALRLETARHVRKKRRRAGTKPEKC